MFKKILFLFLILTAPAFAQLSLNPNEAPKVKAQLIAEEDGIAPGKSVWVAMRQEITPGWHTYWRNPGDTGLATTLAWDLPVGYTASELQFPTPHKQPTGELVNYGYNDAVILLARITAPATAQSGETISLKAKASWLVCQEICIPETDNLTIDLKVTNSPIPSAWSSAFIAAKDKLPKPHQSAQSVKVNEETIEITLGSLPLAADELPEEVYFFPHDGLLIQHNAPQKLLLDGRSLHLTIPKNKTRTSPITEVTGDIMLRLITGEKSFQFSAKVEQPKPVAAVIPTVTTPQASVSNITTENIPLQPNNIGLFAAIISAFIGGVLLNLMPCVFPVLSLKALGLVNKSQNTLRQDVVAGGFAYLGGVLMTFTLLGIILITLKNAGHHIGWGVQLQSPAFVAALALLLFFIGYSLSGAIMIGSRFMGIGNNLTQKSSLAGSFFTGALAVIVATPCTAPFMGGAVFYALTQNAAITLLVLWALGLGLALPYLLLTLFPNVLLKYLPKPGIWMEHFKQFLTFPMIAASIWLVWVLNQQTGSLGMLHALFGMLFLAFSLWLWGTTQNRPANLWQTAKAFIALLIFIFAIGLTIDQPKPLSLNTPSANENYEAFTPQKLSDYRKDNRPVFVNMTAAWCITCLANEKAALGSDAVKNYFQENNIAYLKGDWTNFDEAITAYLKGFGRSGVPIYVFYPADQKKSPVTLPQILTPDTVINTIKQGM